MFKTRTCVCNDGFVFSFQIVNQEFNENFVFRFFNLILFEFIFNEIKVRKMTFLFNNLYRFFLEFMIEGFEFCAFVR